VLCGFLGAFTPPTIVHDPAVYANALQQVENSQKILSNSIEQTSTMKDKGQMALMYLDLAKKTLARLQGIQKLLESLICTDIDFINLRKRAKGINSCLLDGEIAYMDYEFGYNKGFVLLLIHEVEEWIKLVMAFKSAGRGEAVAKDMSRNEEKTLEIMRKIKQNQINNISMTRTVDNLLKLEGNAELAKKGAIEYIHKKLKSEKEKANRPIM
jgi:hypothetical protein